MIPEAAVEAAVKELERSQDIGYSTWWTVQNVLEAAAPHMLAEAWDEGFAIGNRHDGRRDANPYRGTA